MRGDKSPARIEWIAASVAVVSLFPRLWIAAHTWLNADEAGYFLHSTGGSLAEVYWNSLYTHHPPLLILILHFVRQVSTSELALRLVPVLAGSLCAWFAYRWVSGVWNRMAGLLVLLILAFAPFLLRLSAEARGYSLVLLAMAAYLYLQDRALEGRSSRWMLVAGAPFAMGILAEYSMAMLAASAGLYFLIRAWAERPPARLLAAWGVVQLGGLALYGFLYVNQIQRMAGQAGAESNRAGWLAGAFPGPGENLVAYALGAVADQFHYLFGLGWLGAAGMGLFVFGWVLLWRRGASGRASAVLLILPFLFSLAANLAGYFPFGYTRHTSFLGLFIAAGVGVAGERSLRGRSSWLWAAAIVMPLWAMLMVRSANSVAWDRHSRNDMVAALADVRNARRDGGPVLCDQATAWILEYYLGGVKLPYREYEYAEREQVERDLELLVTDAERDHDRYWMLDGGWYVLDFRIGESVGGLVVAERWDSGGAMRVYRLEKNE